MILAGRYAGRKAVIVRVITNSADRKFGHCIGMSRLTNHKF